MAIKRGRMAVYIEGHAESLVDAAHDGTRAVDKLTNATERLEREQKHGSKGFASYSTATSKTGKSLDTLGEKQHRVRNGMVAMGKSAALAGAAVAAGIVVEIKRSTEAYEESYKVGRQTNAVIKSTAGVAKVSAAHVGDLANSISLKSGIDDEAIQTGENLLLTFKNVHNEAGKGNKIFDQATRVATDMSVAMGKDLTSTVLGVGKALNDPIKGISALSRVGVTFTEGQQDQIKALTETGKTMTAQKIVLRELKSEFGGSAEAQATPLAKMKVAVENLEEALGSVFFPTVSKVAGALAKFLNQIQSGTGAGGRFKAWVKEAAKNVSEFAGVVKDKVSSVVNSLKQFWKESSVTRAVVTGAFKWMKQTAKDSIATILQILKGAVQIIRGVVKVISGVLTGDFGRAWDGVKDIFSGTVKVILNNLKLAYMPFARIAGKIGDGIAGAFRLAWGGITGIFESGVNKAIGWLNKLIDAINFIPGVPDIGHVGELGGDGGGKGGGKSKQPWKKGVSAWARGGPMRVAGQGNDDTVPLYRDELVAMVAPGEDLFVANKHQRPMLDEAVRDKYGVSGLDGFYKRYDRPHNMAKGGGVPGFLNGGDVLGKVGDVAKSAFNTAKGAIGALPTPHLPGFFSDIGGYVLGQVGDWIKSGFSSGKLGNQVTKSNARGVLSPAEFLQIARQALAITGHKGLPGGARKLLKLAMQESSLNTNSINNWDSNAKAGNPSGGLMHTTESTFNAYHEPGTANTYFDPLASIAASINYQFAEYGGLVTHSPYARGGRVPGYAKGGAVKGTAARAVAWAKNNVGVQEGSKKHGKWVAETEGVADPWCAEFVAADLLAQGVPIPANSAYTGSYGEGWGGGEVVGNSMASAKPGDLLAFGSDEHIGIYVGGGRMIAGNWNNEVAEYGVSEDSRGVSRVTRPKYPGGEGGAAGKAKSKFTPKFGIAGHKPLTVAGLHSKPLGKAAKALPKAIQALLSQPGLSYSQRLGIGQYATDQASSTFQPLLDENGNPVLDEEGNQIDSRADDKAAARFVLGLVKADKKRTKKTLNRVSKRLHGRQSAAKRKRDIKKRNALLERLASDDAEIAAARETIRGEGDTASGSGEDKTQEEILAAIEAQNELLRTQVQDVQRSYNVSQGQYGVLKQAIAEIASGQIGGKIGLGFAAPTVPGKVASL